jgi:hypothetical protein
MITVPFRLGNIAIVWNEAIGRPIAASVAQQAVAALCAPRYDRTPHRLLRANRAASGGGRLPFGALLRQIVDLAGASEADYQLAYGDPRRCIQMDMAHPTNSHATCTVCGVVGHAGTGLWAVDDRLDWKTDLCCTGPCYRLALEPKAGEGALRDWLEALERWDRAALTHRSSGR